MVPVKFPILFENGGLIAVDKPSGVLSHPNLSQKSSGGQKPRATPAIFKGNYDFEDRRFETSEGPVWLIHRLDKGTSGVILAAREVSAARDVRKLFEEGKIKKEYIALILGRPFPLRGIWRDHILEKKRPDHVRSMIEPGRVVNAELKYSVVKTFSRDALSLVDIQLVTGKTHQIRAQSSFRRSPVAGDEVYGNFSENRKLRKSIGLKRLFLHAHKLSFKHPKTGEMIEITSPLPPDLTAVLDRAK